MPDSASSSASTALAQAVAARRDQLTGKPASGCSVDTWLFARLVAARDVRGELALLGLSAEQLAELARRHFAPAAAPVLPAIARTLLPDDHAAFVAALTRLLLAHSGPDVRGDDAQCVATIIAHACLRPDHLWRDLGLDGRDDVTRMLERYVPALVARNVDNLRWKKFLARELALSTGAAPGPAPGCPGCEDFGFCFPRDR